MSDAHVYVVFRARICVGSYNSLVWSQRSFFGYYEGLDSCQYHVEVYLRNPILALHLHSGS